jgi:hypothetical protein
MNREKPQFAQIGFPALCYPRGTAEGVMDTPRQDTSMLMTEGETARDQDAARMGDQRSAESRPIREWEEHGWMPQARNL